MLTPTTFRTELARSFHRDIVNANDFFHLFIGKATEWDNEPFPEETLDTSKNLAEVRKNILGVKRITPLDAVLLIRRIDWETGKVFARWDDAEPMENADFYVMTETFRVYKCLGNAQSSFSTVNPASEDPLLSPEPLTTIVEKFSTSDGYWWQFMFEVPVSDRIKFLTPEYIPVRFYSTSDTFDYNGIVDTVVVTNGGSGYTTPPSVVILGDGFGAVAEATISLGGEVTGVTVVDGGEGYTFAMVNFVGGDGAGAVGEVTLIGVETPTNVNEAVAAFANATAGSIEFVDVEAQGDGYSPSTTNIQVIGDGENCVLVPVVNNGKVERVIVASTGTGYTFAEAIVVSPTGVGAVLRPIVGPRGGHGSNLPQELYASTVGISVTLPDSLEDLFIGNEFRQYGIVKNLKGVDFSIFSENSGRTTYVLKVDDATEFEADDVVRSSSGGEFTVVSINTTDNWVSILPKIDLLAVTDTLENLRTAQSGIEIEEILDAPEIIPHSGTLVMLDNIPPIIRQDDQAETITLHIEF